MSRDGEGPRTGARQSIRLALCGDVMTGRGIDQTLAHPCDPRLQEPYVRDAREYVALAEQAHGAISRPLAPRALWGEALPELDRAELRVVNLETAVTTSDDAWSGKGIHYRMNPENISCLTAARLDCCVLANNHVLDWGRRGLLETLRALREAGIPVAGAGRDRSAAAEPAALALPGSGRVLVFACGEVGSGIPRAWAATEEDCGVQLLPDLSIATARRLGQHVRATRRAGDIVVMSIHWGGNWGYEIPAEQRDFARTLVDDGGADVVHGHSSHHPKAIEIHGGRAILYGCGDFLDDYEGISGYESYRDDLAVIYTARLHAATGALLELELVPFVIRGFSLRRPSAADLDWLVRRLDRECRKLGSRVELGASARLRLLPQGE